MAMQTMHHQTAAYSHNLDGPCMPGTAGAGMRQARSSSAPRRSVRGRLRAIPHSPTGGGGGGGTTLAVAPGRHGKRLMWLW